MFKNKLKRFTLTVLLICAIHSHMEEKIRRLLDCQSAIPAPIQFENFEAVITYYDGLFASMSAEVQTKLKQISETLKVGGDSYQGNMMTTITYGKGWVIENSIESTAQLLFKLIAAGNLLGIYQPTQEEQENTPIPLYLQNTICRSLVVEFTANQSFNDNYITTNDGNNRLSAVYSFAGLTSDVGFEDTMAPEDRATRTANYIQRFKENWPFFKAYLAQSSELTAQMDTIVNSDFDGYIVNDFPNLHSINKLLSKIIYERVFHEVINAEEEAHFDMNIDYLFNVVTTDSFCAKFNSLVTESTGQTDNEIFKYVYDNWPPTSNKIIAYANNVAPFYNEANALYQMIPHIFKLILIEQYMVAANPDFPEKDIRFHMLKQVPDRTLDSLIDRYLSNFIQKFLLLDYTIQKESFESIDTVFGSNGCSEEVEDEKVVAVVDWLKTFKTKTEEEINEGNVELTPFDYIGSVLQGDLGENYTYLTEFTFSTFLYRLLENIKEEAEWMDSQGPYYIRIKDKLASKDYYLPAATQEMILI